MTWITTQFEIQLTPGLYLTIYCLPGHGDRPDGWTWFIQVGVDGATSDVIRPNKRFDRAEAAFAHVRAWLLENRIIDDEAALPPFPSQVNLP